MMLFIYNLAIHSYHLLILLFSLFSKKAKQWRIGRKSIFRRLQKDIGYSERIIWFHAASLGEFEQGRPVIEKFRKHYPGYKLLLTFFSPSGYEIRKDYENADLVYYLPIDTKRNALRFLRIVQPKLAVFIKYEFWFNYLNALKNERIPVYTISAIFRKDQHFFKWYGSWFREQLSKISGFFVQDENSKNLLQSIGITNVEVSGDTRFDRVNEVVRGKKTFPLVELFSRDSTVILAGSSWPADEKLLTGLLEQQVPDLKLIIAPHEIHEERIRFVSSLFEKHKTVRYSKATEEEVFGARVLIIDGMGFLSGLYQYCKIACIGGGYGKGIHNILEAVAFGKPVVFGPNYEKFAEARDLISLKGAFSVNDKHEFTKTVNELLLNDTLYHNASKTCNDYIQTKTGATDIIFKNIKLPE